MESFNSFAFLSVLLAAASGQEYCTEPVRRACNSEVGASICITAQCSSQTSTGDANFRQTIIDAHNKYRSEPVFGLYGANTLELQWNPELEDGALRWLQHLCEKNNMFHDENQCRETPSFKDVGQNLYTSTANFTNISVAAQNAVDDWHAEKELVGSIKELNPYAFSAATGHYTQVIWADSYLLGCAYLSKMSESNGNKAWVACNYAPGGNVIGKNTFQASDSLGSNCTTGSGQDASGLCKACRKADLNKALKLEPPK